MAILRPGTVPIVVIAVTVAIAGLLAVRTAAETEEGVAGTAEEGAGASEGLRSSYCRQHACSLHEISETAYLRTFLFELPAARLGLPNPLPCLD